MDIGYLIKPLNKSWNLILPKKYLMRIMNNENYRII